MSVQPAVSVLSPAIAVTRTREHIVAMIKSSPSPQTVRQLESLFGGGTSSFAYYLFLSEGASPPDEATRAELRRLAGRLGPRLHAVVVVLELPGFLGATLRGVITGMAFALSYRQRASAHATIDDAVRWTAGVHRTRPEFLPLTADELRAARALLAPHAAQ